MKAQAKGGRKRVSRDKVRENAKTGGGGGKLLRLPSGVSSWTPEKSGKHLINILPYEVKVSNHPDSVEKGGVWYKRPFGVHRSVGPEQTKIVCPTSIGKPCPICEHAKKLRVNYEANKEAISAINPQKWVMFNIQSPDDPEQVAVFAFSRGKFAAVLEDEIQQQTDDTNLFFYDCNEDGRTLIVRFKDDKHMGQAFIQADRIDFKPRPAMDEEEVFSKTVDLDSILIVLPYAQIKGMFNADDSDDADADDDGEVEEVEVTPPAKTKAKKAPVPAEEDEVDADGYDADGNRPGRPGLGASKSRGLGDDDEDDVPAPPKKKAKSLPPPVDDDDEDLAIDASEDEDGEEAAPPPKKKLKPAPPVEDDDEDDAPPPPKKGKRPPPPVDDEDDD